MRGQAVRSWVRERVRNAIGRSCAGHGAATVHVMENVETTGIRGGRTLLWRSATRPKARSPLAGSARRMLARQAAATAAVALAAPAVSGSPAAGSALLADRLSAKAGHETPANAALLPGQLVRTHTCTHTPPSHRTTPAPRRWPRTGILVRGTRVPASARRPPAGAARGLSGRGRCTSTPTRKMARRRSSGAWLASPICFPRRHSQNFGPSKSAGRR
jgi:hypothetical protein